jgi:Protein of unknwon function (DUF3310)
MKTKILTLKRDPTVKYEVDAEQETFIKSEGAAYFCVLCEHNFERHFFEHIRTEHPIVYGAFKLHYSNADLINDPKLESCLLTNLFIVEQLDSSMESDPVNHPSHYTFGKYEVLPVLMDWFATQPLLWQVVKYLSRARHKGNYLQDLKKAEFYLKKAIEDAENEEKTISGKE